MKTLLINLHLGLGDCIICNALIRHYAAKYDRLFLPTKRENSPTVRWMFSDLPQVVVKELDYGDEEMAAFRKWYQAEFKGDYIGLGLYGANFRGADWDRCFYDQAGLPFEQRWDGFKVPDKESKTIGDWGWWNPFQIFVHDRWSGGRADLRRPTESIWFQGEADRFFVEQYPTPNLGDYVSILRGALEIHCVSSSIAILVDSIELPNKPRLYLHHYARTDVEPVWRKEWVHLR